MNNIIGGVIASFIFWFLCSGVPWIRKKLRGRKFKKVFGSSHMVDDFPLVCGKLYCPQGFVFTKPKAGPNVQFKVSTMISNTDIVAYDYLKKAFVKEVRVNVKACLDEDLTHPLSYCSFGCLNNLMTLKVLNDAKNRFYNFQNGFLNKRTQKSFCCNGTADYGVIIKVSDELTKSVQICVAGLGESGTTGSAYFLANRWQELERKFGDKDFGCIIEVRNFCDSSAKMVDFVS